MIVRDLPFPERALARLLLRGPGAEFVLGDIVERYRHDLQHGGDPRNARRRARRQILASASALWWPFPSRGWAGGSGAEDAGPGQAGPTGDRKGLGGGGGGMATGLWWDLVVALRGLRRRPGFSVGAALTLGLGIGATTSIYSVVDHVLLRPLDYEDAGRLVAVGTVFPSRPWADEESGLYHLASMSLLNVQDLSARTRSLESLAAFELRNVLIPDQGNGPELALAAGVSRDFFAVLGISPALGRLFLPDEHDLDAAPAVLLSYGAWQRRYGGDPDVLDRSMAHGEAGATIVGVLPADFAPPEAFVSRVPEFWMPIQPDDDRYADRGRRSMMVIGRLHPETDLSAARAEADEIAAQLASDYPDGNAYPDGSWFGVGINGLKEQTLGTTSRILRIFLAAAGLLLLLAALNAASLLFARALDRRGELGVRMALGAGRARVVRLLLVEAGVLAGLGGVIGVALSKLGTGAFVRFAPGSIPRLSEVAVDGQVLALAASVSIAAGAIAGLLPALRLTRERALIRSGRSVAEPASRLRNTLVGAQMALAVLLLAGAGLLFSSFLGLRSVDPGFVPEDLVSMNVGLKRLGAEDEPAWQGWDRLLAEVASIPGVESVAGTSNPPFQDPFWAPRLLLPGDSPDMWREGVAGYSITPGYLSTLGTRLIAGRDFSRSDGPESEPVILVNETFVRTQLNGRDPLGVTVRHVSEGRDRGPMRIVGVVEDVVQARAQQGPRAAIYVPYTQSDWPFVQAVVRTRLPPETILPQLRQAARRFNPIAPARDVRTLEDRMAATRTTPRFHALLIGVFAAVALALASAGLYGTLAHGVRRRQRELGIRISLGAGRRGLIWMVLRQAMALSTLGLLTGLAGALALGRVLSGFLYGVEPHDPLTLMAVGVALLAVSAAACVLPARRATAVDPVSVLNAE